MNNESGRVHAGGEDIFCPPAGVPKLSKNARRSARRRKAKEDSFLAYKNGGGNVPAQQSSQHGNGNNAVEANNQNNNKRNSQNKRSRSKSRGKQPQNNKNSYPDDVSKKSRVASNDRDGLHGAAAAQSSNSNHKGKLAKDQKEEKKRRKEDAKKKVADRVPFRPSLPESGVKKILVWNSTLDYIPLANELALKKEAYLGRGKEYGMLEHQTPERLARIRAKCEALTMTFRQASSLRSHYIMQHNRYSNARDKLGLMSEALNREAAALFEDCVATFLEEHEIPYMDEDEQKRIQPHGSSTPDNLLRETVDLKWKNNALFEINWVECKMFYAASTIPLDNKSAVGRLLTTARKYVDKFGTGAIVFSCGCGDEIATKLRDVGVIAVDADAITLTPLDNHRDLHTANPPPRNNNNSNNNRSHYNNKNSRHQSRGGGGRRPNHRQGHRK